MREELGFHSEAFDPPLRSGIVVGLSYLIGAAVPVIPYAIAAIPSAVALSAAATVAVLFIVGAAKTVITARSWWRSGLESMLTGIAAAVVTYGAGRLFGAR